MGKTVWTFEKVRDEALKYSSKSEFQQKNANCYASASRNKWLKLVCGHMTQLRSSKWTLEACLNVAKDCSKTEFRKKHIGAYSACIENGWISEINNIYNSTRKSWNYSSLENEALLYNTRGEFKANSNSAYNAARKLGVLNDICKHMIYKYKSFDNWTYDECLNISKNYKTKKEFNEEQPNIVRISKLSGFYDDITEHMVSGREIIWTFDNCKLVALKFKSRSEFQNQEASCYQTARVNKWLDTICNHMVSLQKESGYWTKERCKQEALLYSTKTDFYNNSGSAYHISSKMGWRDEICVHMKPKGHYNSRFIYSYEFLDIENNLKYVYVGLTCREEKRINEHKTYGTVYDFYTYSNIKPIYKKLTDFVTAEEASKLEKIKLDEYKKSEWVILNKTQAGSLGSSIKWTFNSCKKIANTCKDIYEFKRKSTQRCFAISKNNNWLSIFFPNEILIQNKITKKLTKEECHELANKYTSRYKFSISENAAYRLAIHAGWIDEFFPNTLKKNTKSRNYWTKENVYKEAIKYTKRGEFSKNSMVAYVISRKNGWLDEFFPKKKTKEQYREICKEYITIKELKDNNNEIYYKIKTNKWIREFFPKNKT